MARPQFRLVPYRLWPGINWFLIVVTLTLAVCGVLTLWGATSDGRGPGPLRGFALKQIIFSGLGLVLMVALIVFDYRLLKRATWVLYGLLIVALAGLLLKGHAIKGAVSWYNLGGFTFQPSEPGKIVVILALAHYLAPRMTRFRGLRHTLVPLGIVAVPLLLILVQPALGSAAVLVPVTAALFWVAGLRRWIFVAGFALGILVCVVGYPHLKDYQKERIKTFVDPGADPRGKGWNILQSQTALGSGELFGKHWGHGTQTTFRYLPEYHTDFIFPTVGEQFGLVGCLAVLGLLLCLVGALVHLAGVVQNLYGVLIVTGLATMLATHVVLNVGMCVGLLPVTGLPLPFFSYGGSFVLTCMGAVGLALGIGARRGL